MVISTKILLRIKHILNYASYGFSAMKAYGSVPPRTYACIFDVGELLCSRCGGGAPEPV
jgi:hypothetical protein